MANRSGFPRQGPLIFSRSPHLKFRSPHPGFSISAHFWVLEHQVSYKLLVLPWKDGYISIRPEQILYIQANDNYCKAVSSSGMTFILRKTLKDIEHALTKTQFCGTKFTRVHSSYIICLSDVRFDKTLTEATLSNGERIPISRTYRNNLNEDLLFL